MTEGLTVRHREESKPWDFKEAKANLLWKTDLRTFDSFGLVFLRAGVLFLLKRVMGGVQESFSALQISLYAFSLHRYSKFFPSWAESVKSIGSGWNLSSIIWCQRCIWIDSQVHSHLFKLAKPWQKSRKEVEHPVKIQSAQYTQILKIWRYCPRSLLCKGIIV